MKFGLFLLIISSILISPMAEEGIIVRFEYPERTTSQTWYVTENVLKMRHEVKLKGYPDYLQWFVVDLKAEKLYNYREGDISKQCWVTKRYDVEQETNTQLTNVAVKRTERLKTILGFKCRKYVLTGETLLEMKHVEADVWVTEDFKTEAYKFYPYFPNNRELLAIYTNRIKGFPLAYESHTTEPGGQYSLEPVSVEYSDFTDTAFVTPAGYHLVDF